MTKSMLLCGLVLGATPLLTPAKDFPLEFKTLTAQEAMAFPGGSGAVTSLQLDRPADIVKAPPAVSRQPLYGQLSAGTGRLWCRLDESKGNGKGYDRLLVDVNQNGDLTDDAAVQRVAPAGQTSVMTQNPEIALFGPIPAPDSKKIGDWRPIYFAQAYLYTLPANAGALPRNLYLGQLRLKAGWYLETTVDLDGVTRKVGIVDGNCNFRLGDLNQPIASTSGAETNWYFQGGDYFLVDNDGTARFQNSVGNDSSAPFGPLLYLGAKPCRAALAADGKSLALEPWTGPLAELALQPRGGQVSRIQVAWEGAPGQWQLLQAGVENGKATVPPGNYWLYSCQIKVKTSPDETLVMSGIKRAVKEITKAEAGAATPFKCGPPLDIKVSSSRDTSVVVATTSGSRSVFSRLLGNSRPADQPLQQRIQASVVGAGGETYSGFYLLGGGNVRQPSQPTYTILTANGKLVESGNMEFG
jgi:hypothetical protein